MFGGLCAIVGVFTLTLPIPIVVNSFAGFYKNRLWRNEVAQKKRLRIEMKKRKSKSEKDPDLILTPESREALIKVNIIILTFYLWILIGCSTLILHSRVYDDDVNGRYLSI